MANAPKPPAPDVIRPGQDRTGHSGGGDLHNVKLVALRVGHGCPTVPALFDVPQAGCPESHEALDFFVELRGNEVDMDAVLGLFGLGHFVEHPRWARPRAAIQADGGEIYRRARINRAIEHLGPESGQLAGVGAIQADGEKANSHQSFPFCSGRPRLVDHISLQPPPAGESRASQATRRSADQSALLGRARQEGWSSGSWLRAAQDGGTVAGNTAISSYELRRRPIDTSMRAPPNSAITKANSTISSALNPVKARTADFAGLVVVVGLAGGLVVVASGAVVVVASGAVVVVVVERGVVVVVEAGGALVVTAREGSGLASALVGGVFVVVVTVGAEVFVAGTVAVVAGNVVAGTVVNDFFAELGGFSVVGTGAVVAGPGGLVVVGLLAGAVVVEGAPEVVGAGVACGAVVRPGVVGPVVVGGEVMVVVTPVGAAVVGVGDVLVAAGGTVVTVVEEPTGAEANTVTVPGA